MRAGQDARSCHGTQPWRSLPDDDPTPPRSSRSPPEPQPAALPAGADVRPDRPARRDRRPRGRRVRHLVPVPSARRAATGGPREPADRVRGSFLGRRDDGSTLDGRRVTRRGIRFDRVGHRGRPRRDVGHRPLHRQRRDRDVRWLPGPGAAGGDRRQHRRGPDHRRDRDVRPPGDHRVEGVVHGQPDVAHVRRPAPRRLHPPGGPRVRASSRTPRSSWASRSTSARCRPTERSPR